MFFFEDILVVVATSHLIKAAVHLETFSPNVLRACLSLEEKGVDDDSCDAYQASKQERMGV